MPLCNVCGRTVQGFFDHVDIDCLNVDPDAPTPVLFRRDGKEIVAVFPTIDEGRGQVSCYVHLGQHSGCTRGWYAKTKRATPDEYAVLKAELEAAPYRYRLKVLQRWPARA